MVAVDIDGASEERGFTKPLLLDPFEASAFTPVHERCINYIVYPLEGGIQGAGTLYLDTTPINSQIGQDNLRFKAAHPSEKVQKHNMPGLGIF